MSAFLYGVALQWKLDIRSKSLLITCYIIPLLFFALLGGIFTSVNPEAKDSLIQSMTVMGVSIGALVGMPPSLVEIYGSDIKRVYKANGVPLYLGLVTMLLSTFIHLLIMCAIIYIAAPIAFNAVVPSNFPIYICSLLLFIAVSLIIGGLLGLSFKKQAKLTMVSQLIFLPSIMLSGIMFPSDLLPRTLGYMGRLFPAAWGFKLMTGIGFNLENALPLGGIFLGAVLLCILCLRRLKTE